MPLHTFQQVSQFAIPVGYWDDTEGRSRGTPSGSGPSPLCGGSVLL
jgi:hypothetical protein